MLEYIREEANKTYTENGAVTLESTGSECLDLFASIGALRRESDEEIILRFARAYAENPDMAMKLLFYSRDIRGGLGERRVFRVIMNWLANNESESVLKNLEYVSEFGRFDDLLSLFGTRCEKAMLSVIESQLKKDIEALDTKGEVSLLAKWIPSVNASNTETVRKSSGGGRSSDTPGRLRFLRGHWTIYPAGPAVLNTDGCCRSYSSASMQRERSSESCLTLML